MGGTNYVGRVGGLAVALGTGFAILSGQGVAAADTGDAHGPPSTSATSASEPTPTDKDTPATPIAATSSPASTTTRRLLQQDASLQRTTQPFARHGVTRLSIGDDQNTAGTDTDDLALTSTHAAQVDGTPRSGNTSRVSRGSTQTPTAATERTATLVATPAAPAPKPTPAPLAAAAATLLPATRSQAATRSVDYAPAIDVHEGVITGHNDAPNESSSGRPLTYTVLGKPDNGGKVVINGDGDGDFSFLPSCTASGCTNSDSFRVLVAEQSRLDALLEDVPVVKALVKPIVLQLHRIPIVRDVLAPIIGRSAIYTIVVPVSQLVAGQHDPIAFTTTIASFDGTPISVNYFPAVGLVDGGRAPTILNGPSLATAGYIDPTQTVTVFGLVPGLKPLRAGGYNVVTWDPRGEFASGGILHLDSPDYEARDVSAIIDWVALQSTTKFDDPSDPDGPAASDPLLGMAGGSYGGGIQLTTAGIDDRIDVIAPGIAWNSLTEALYPNHAFKTSWAALLLLSLVSQGSRIDAQIYSGILTGVTLGVLLPGAGRFLEANSPYHVVPNIAAPTLFLQGTVDTLFTLQQALDNANQLPDTVPVQMIWYCGGHGKCLDPGVDQDAQTKFLVDRTMAWLDTYLQDSPPAERPPKFTWVDQNGDWHTSDFLPNEAGFSSSSISVTGAGGSLAILPIFGGSGPQGLGGFPVSLVSGSRAARAVEVQVPGLPQSATEPVYLVGAPQLTFTYSGVGTSRNVYAQLVDNETGRVVGNIVSPIRVTLDGTRRTVDVPMENIAYTMTPGSQGLTLQIVDSATPFEDFISFGFINVSSITLTLPRADAAGHLILAAPEQGEAYQPASTPTLEELLLGRSPR